MSNTFESISQNPHPIIETLPQTALFSLARNSYLGEDRVTKATNPYDHYSDQQPTADVLEPHRGTIRTIRLPLQNALQLRFEASS